MVIENMDGDSDGVPGSDMRTNSYSEYGGHGKLTSNDPIDDGGSSEAGSGTHTTGTPQPIEHYDGPNVLAVENERKEARARRIAPYKNTLIGFVVHTVIFILGLHLKLYSELNVMISSLTEFPALFIVLPFSAEPTLGSIFGSLYLILPLFIYYFALGRKGLIVFPIVFALILLGFLLEFPVIPMGIP